MNHNLCLVHEERLEKSCELQMKMGVTTFCSTLGCKSAQNISFCNIVSETSKKIDSFVNFEFKIHNVFKNPQKRYFSRKCKTEKNGNLKKNVN